MFQHVTGTLIQVAGGSKWPTPVFFLLSTCLTSDLCQAPQLRQNQETPARSGSN